MKRVGVISDTHGLLRPAAVDAFSGVDHIIHAGDIGSSEVLGELARLAPVTAVRGNNDKGSWARSLPLTQVTKIEGRSLYVLHDIAELDLDPAAAGFSAVIAGHSHKPTIETKGGVLFLNPGSAGPRRFKLPVSLALIELDTQSLQAHVVTLL
jgi:uncharacterized protein